MNIVKREISANFKALVTWSLGMIFLIYAGMLKYTGFAGAGQEVTGIFDQLPPSVRAILGLGELDVTTITGYYAVFYLYFMLLSGIHAIMLGAVIVSKEEHDKTGDFLFTRPVKRSQIVTAKLIAVFVNIIVLNQVTFFASVFFMNLYHEGPPITGIIAQLMAALLILQLIFAVAGAGIASVSRNMKRAASLSAAILLSGFFISVAIDIYDKIAFLKFLTPFQYFPAAEIIGTKGYNLFYLIPSCLIILLSIIITYRFTEKRDIHI